MAAIQAKEYLDRAEKGEKLSTQERRHAIAFLMGTTDKQYDEYKTNAELAALFQVTSRTITDDRKIIREEVADSIKSEDVGLVIADLRMAFEKTMRNIEKSANKAKLGTKTYLDHQTAAFKLQRDFMEGMQSLGIYPKDLGTLHHEKFEFSAQVGMQAELTPRPVKLFDNKALPTIEAEIVTRKALTDGKDSETETQSGEADDFASPDSGEAGDAGSASSAQLPAVQADQGMGMPLGPSGSSS